MTNTSRKNHKNLVAVTYMSHCLIKPENLDKECAEIKRISSAKNSEAEISGILILRRGRFIQRLEGEKTAVNQLIDIIEADKRHRKFKILHFAEISQRYFDDWSQMQVITEGEGFDELDQLIINLETGNREVVNDQESRFIVNFIQHYTSS